MNVTRVRSLLVGLFAVLAVGAVPASAQDETPVDLVFDGGTVAIKHDVQTSAEVEMVVGDQLYVLTVPVTIQIDDNMLLEAAGLTAPTSQIVGVFAVEPIGVETIAGEYEKQFRTVTPGDDEVVVVYRANVTNLHSETIETGFTSNLDVVAVDAVGNSYEEDTRLCDDINPGATMECEFIFMAPAGAELVDLQVKAVDYERFSFPAEEATE